MTSKANTKNYAQLNAELQQILDWFESADFNIDEAPVKYQQAMKMIQQIKDRLTTAQNQVEKIKQKFDS